MLTLELSFPTGRYHATPWDRQVNEGAVEWPPSPWRVLRSLLATWYLKAQDEVDETLVRSLATSLARELPSYSLPPAVAAHTRHFMPIAADKTTKVFDAFLHLGRQASLFIHWPGVDLRREEQEGLDSLLFRLGYLGRAESWVEARRVTGLHPKATAVPLEEALSRGLDDGEVVAVLAPIDPGRFRGWRERALAARAGQRLAGKCQRARKRGKPMDKIRLTAADRTSVEDSVPEDVFAALCADTGVLRQEGWNQPPGSRWVDYQVLRADESNRPLRSPARREPIPTVARFAVVAAVPPALTDLLPLAERVRQGLLSRSDAAPVFSGRAQDGQLLCGHRHAYILPEANGRGGVITHVTLYAPMGFDEVARRALDGLRRVWDKRTRGHDLDLVLLGIGRPEDFAGTHREAGQCPLFAQGQEWESRTPFVPTRHPKAYRDGRPKLDETGLQVGSPAQDLRRLLIEAGFPPPALIEPLLSTSLGGKPTRWLAYRTLRKQGGGRRAGHPGCGFRLRFEEPVSGPIALGYGAHFGLGIFVPAGLF